jgi:hypothetical protein
MKEFIRLGKYHANSEVRSKKGSGLEILFYHSRVYEAQAFCDIILCHQVTRLRASEGW